MGGQESNRSFKILICLSLGQSKQLQTPQFVLGRREGLDQEKKFQKLSQMILLGRIKERAG